nr:MAG TPA: hypothetical protein [Bacteriophage sp.]
MALLSITSFKTSLTLSLKICLTSLSRCGSPVIFSHCLQFILSFLYGKFSNSSDYEKAQPNA